jgi:hypothetical protein
MFILLSVRLFGLHEPRSRQSRHAYALKMSQVALSLAKPFFVALGQEKVSKTDKEVKPICCRLNSTEAITAVRAIGSFRLNFTHFGSLKATQILPIICPITPKTQPRLQKLRF